ncbi:MAG: T9SS type A sorting domain-containing protein [Bacteroidales bacterium]
MVTYHLVGYETAEWYVFVDVVTDIPEYLFSQVKVGPNPASGEINIENTRNLSVFVYNTLGRIVYESFVGEMRIALTDLQPGFYFIKLEKDDKSEVRKVIVN